MMSCSKIANETPDFRNNPFPCIENPQQINQEQRSKSCHRKITFYPNQGHLGGKVIHTDMGLEDNYFHGDKENLSKSELHNNGRLRFLPQTTKSQVERRNNQQINISYTSNEKENSLKHGSPQRRAALSLLEEAYVNPQPEQNLYYGNSFDRVVTEIPKSPTLVKHSYFNSYCTKGLTSEKISLSNLSNNKNNKALQSLLMSPVKIIQPSGGSHSISRTNRLYSQHLSKDMSQPCLPRIPSSDSMDVFKKDNSISIRSPKQNISLTSNIEQTSINSINNTNNINNINIKSSTHVRVKSISRERPPKIFLIPPENALNREKTPNFTEEVNENSLKGLVEKVVEQKRQNMQESLQTTIKSPQECFEFSFSKKFMNEIEEKIDVEEDKEAAENKDYPAETSTASNSAELKITKEKKKLVLWQERKLF